MLVGGCHSLPSRLVAGSLGGVEHLLCVYTDPRTSLNNPTVITRTPARRTNCFGDC